MKIHVLENDTETTVTAAPGITLMEALRSADVAGVVAECGGAMACASCHVFIAEDWLSKTGEVIDMEDDMLDCTSTERKAGSRLSCQIKLTEALDGIKISIPESQI